jgi:hypothetical protein
MYTYMHVRFHWLSARVCIAFPEQIGAFMNNAYQATHGVPTEAFPEETDVWLGHYHMPHVVSDSQGKPTRVRYVGSPYQGTPRLPSRFTPLFVPLFSVELIQNCFTITFEEGRGAHFRPSPSVTYDPRLVWHLRSQTQAVM